VTDTETEGGGEGVPDRPGLGPLLARLRVRRNAVAGGVVGLVVAAALYAVRVFELLGPPAGRQSFPVVGAEAWFVLLALVLATSTAAAVATLLTLVAAYGAVRE
jgi:hypothetical protein